MWIGSNVVVLCDVRDNSIAVGVAARVTLKRSGQSGKDAGGVNVLSGQRDGSVGASNG